eukprot:379575-Prorocentrum_lima.AAC.1
MYYLLVDLMKQLGQAPMSLQALQQMDPALYDDFRRHAEATVASREQDKQEASRAPLAQTVPPSQPAQPALSVPVAPPALP